MANPNVVINSVVYSDCPEVDIPKQGGGTAKFYFTGDASAAAGDVLSGKSFFGSSGEDSGGMPNNGGTGGTISTKSGTVTIPAGYTSGGTVSIASAAVTDCVSGSILSGKTILGVSGSLNMPSISQDAYGVLSIS